MAEIEILGDKDVSLCIFSFSGCGLYAFDDYYLAF